MKENEKKTASGFSDLFFSKLLSARDWLKLFEDEYDVFYRALDNSNTLDSYSVRNLHLCALLADYLLDEKGYIKIENLEFASSKIKRGLQSLNPPWESDGLRTEQISRVLDWLKDPTLRQEFHSIRAMSSKQVVQLIHATVSILPYRKLAAGASINGRDARFAVLSSWMTYLRQNVGSCFATAPAILVQSYQPNYFLEDMHQLLSKGAILRVVEGHEFTVPMADSWGLGDFRKRVSLSEGLIESPALIYVLEKLGIISSAKLKANLYSYVFKILETQGLLWKQSISMEEIIQAIVMDYLALSKEDMAQRKVRKKPLEMLMDYTPKSFKNNLLRFEQMMQEARVIFSRLSDHPLLKSWEFSLASFSETKHNFCRWNMYISLGMDSQQFGGVAYRLYNFLNERLEIANRETSQITDQLDQMLSRVNYAVARLQSARGEQEIAWLRTDYRNVKAEYDQLQVEQKHAHTRAKHLANIYNTILDQYDQLFPHYFQEVYDPQIRDGDHGLYEDSPAGFRLTFKAGRHLSSTWQAIYSQEEYVDALVQFFISTETIIAELPEIKPVEKDLNRAVTALVQHVRSKEFMQSAFTRLAQSKGLDIQGVDLTLLENSGCTPWSYISGGTMDALVSHYYGRMETPHIQKFLPHSSEELWVFLIDTLRALPDWQKQQYLNDRFFPLLMHSGDHAFVLRPGLLPFASSWSCDTYPYTWIRDYYLEPMQNFYHGLTLSIDQQKTLFFRLCQAWIPAKKALGDVDKNFTQMARIKDFYSLIEKTIKQAGLEKVWSRGCKSILEGIVWSALPFIDKGDCLERLKELFNEKPQYSVLSIDVVLDRMRELIYAQSSTELMAFEFWRFLLKAFKEAGLGPYSTKIDLWKLQGELYRYRLGPITPFLFADSNWQKDYFGFVLNPVNEQLEIWRIEPKTFIGYPMQDWNKFNQNLENKDKWGVFNKPVEYKIL